MDVMREHLDTQAVTHVALGESIPKPSVIEVGKVGKPQGLWGTNDEVRKMECLGVWC